MLKKCFQKRKGFSLIEAIVAIFVLSVGVVAVVQLFASTASQSRENSRYLTATALAQEGIELVRVVRNDNVVNGRVDIFHGVDTSGCMDAVSHVGLVSCSKDESRLAVLADGQRYQHSSDAPASGYPVFWRKVYVNKVASPESIEVYSVVFFQDPEPSNFPSNANNVVAKCTLQNSCIFLKAVLQ